MASDTSSAVKSADRVFDLFELLAPRSQGLSHTTIAEALGIPKSSLTQLLKTAIHRDYVAFDQDSKTYRLGAKFETMAQPVVTTQNLVSRAKSVLEDVTRTTRESSALNVLNGDMAEVVVTVNSSQRLVSHMQLGDLAPLYATSGGKIMLAHMPDVDIEQYIKRVNFKACTPATITSAKRLLQQIKEIRQEGVARSIEEFTPGIVGLATVVLSRTKTPLASINIAIPTVRYSPDVDAFVLQALRKASGRLQAWIKL